MATHNNQGLVSTTDVAYSTRYLTFKPDVYKDSTLLTIFTHTSAPSLPYTLQGTVLSLGYGFKYEVRELTAHSLALHMIIAPEAFPSTSHPLTAGTVSVGFRTDEYYTR